MGNKSNKLKKKQGTKSQNQNQSQQIITDVVEETNEIEIQKTLEQDMLKDQKDIDVVKKNINVDGLVERIEEIVDEIKEIKNQATVGKAQAEMLASQVKVEMQKLEELNSQTEENLREIENAKDQSINKVDQAQALQSPVNLENKGINENQIKTSDIMIKGEEDQLNNSIRLSKDLDQIIDVDEIKSKDKDKELNALSDQLNNINDPNRTENIEIKNTNENDNQLEISPIGMRDDANPLINEAEVNNKLDQLLGPDEMKKKIEEPEPYGSSEDESDNGGEVVGAKIKEANKEVGVENLEKEKVNVVKTRAEASKSTLRTPTLKLFLFFAIFIPAVLLYFYGLQLNSAEMNSGYENSQSNGGFLSFAKTTLMWFGGFIFAGISRIYNDYFAKKQTTSTGPTDYPRNVIQENGTSNASASNSFLNNGYNSTIGGVYNNGTQFLSGGSSNQQIPHPNLYQGPSYNESVGLG